MSMNISSMFSSLSANNTYSGMDSGSTTKGLSLGDYAAIKNGSYGKLMKAYYKNQSSEEAAKKTDSKQSASMMKSSADALKTSAAKLMDESLFEKKTIHSKDDKTGEESETKDYDWEAITKAVKSFADSYNSVLSKAADSSNKNVLRNGVGMTNLTNRTALNMLNKIGVTVGEDNKLSVDEEKLKKANISDLKTLFLGNGSFADQIMSKASAISRATEGGSGIYGSNATYTDTLNKLVSGSIDTEV